MLIFVMASEYWVLLNTVISASVGAIVSLFVLYTDGKRKRKEKEKEEYDAYKKYSKPLILVSESLAYRLREILGFNASFLLPNAPMNGFFKYKFDSTVYRLCALLGWIRAVEKEQSYIEGFGNSKSSEIRKALNNLQKVLADGTHVEVSIYEELCKLYGIPKANISDAQRGKIGVEIERIVFEYIPGQIKKNAVDITDDNKMLMVSRIMLFVTNEIGVKSLSQELIKEKLSVAIDEIAREFCWLYRDWQSAIGDEMIISLKKSYRYFDVIGFADFTKKHESSKWLSKVDNLFSNLDISIETRFDTRVTQIKLIYKALINLIEKLNLAIEDEEAIQVDSLRNLIDFRDSVVVK